MAQKIYQVDSFTSEPFAGNPAGVCILDAAINEDRMQKIAAEMNLSETAFLYRDGDLYRLRWFTPEAEVSLCGHATLASAQILFEQSICSSEETIRFMTLSGELTAKSVDGMIQLDFPATVATEKTPPDAIVEALGVTALWCGKNKFDWLLELESAEAVRSCSPDFGALKQLGARGLMVTAKSDDDRYDFISRFFAPGVGIDEDPVTGSAHCTLAPYWADKLGKDELVAFQASRRGGVVRIKLSGERVLLSGNALTVMEIDLLV
jgi:PhzF family phenazine biosynthesis protein